MFTGTGTKVACEASDKTLQGLQVPLVLHRAEHKVLKLIGTARCNVRRKVFTTDINEVVTYKFFTSMIPRKAFLGIPFIWFSLRSLNKRTEKKIHCINKENTFLKSAWANGTATCLEKLMLLDLLHHTVFSILLLSSRGLWNELKWLSNQNHQNSRYKWQNFKKTSLKCDHDAGTMPWFPLRVPAAKSYALELQSCSVNVIFSACFCLFSDCKNTWLPLLRLQLLIWN